MDNKAFVTLKFDGKSHEVDLTTYSNVLLDYDSIVKCIAKEYGFSEPISVSVKAANEGSLDAVLSVGTQIVDWVSSGIDPSTLIQTLSSIVGASCGVYQLVKDLKGNNNYELKEKNNNGNISLIIDGKKEVNVDSIVFNTINNYPEVSEKISSTFKKLDNNEHITGFDIMKDGKSAFHADKADFEDLSKTLNINSNNKIKEDVNADLYVVKAILEPSKNRKWQFIYSATRIGASITDNDFLNNLASGKVSFSAGTVINADMTIVKEWNNLYNTWENSNYIVTKVHNVTKPQSNINKSIYDD